MVSRPRCSTSVPSISIAFNLRLSDVAEVRRGYEDPPTLLIPHQGEPALALGVVRRQAAREFASPKVRFAMDSPLEGAGFELVWGFCCQVVILVCSGFFVRSGKAVHRPVACDQVSRSARKGSRDRNGSTAWRLAA
jgi:hypothetical protein